MISKLLVSLRSENEIYKRILNIAENQLSALDGSDVEGFISLMSERAELIDRLSQIDEDIRDLKANWNKLRSKFPSELSKQVVSLIKEQKKLISSILSLDQRAEDRLVKMMSALRRAGVGLTDIARAGEAYIKGEIKSNSRFLDRRG